MFKKKYFFAVVYTILLTVFTAYVLLDTFVIEKKHIFADDGEYYESLYVGDEGTALSDLSEQTGEDYPKRSRWRDGRRSRGNRVRSEAEYNSGSEIDNSGALDVNTYRDDDISVTVTKYREYETDIYVADVRLTSMKYMKTAFAKNAYGRNITEKTSEIAKNNNAILAINGDYYGARNTGYVVRNGVLYRGSAKYGREALMIKTDGSFDIITEGETGASKLTSAGAAHVLSFGPAVVKNGEISVYGEDEFGNAGTRNPRTAIGVSDKLHYYFVVSDGRTSDSKGMSLYQLAEFMKKLGVSTAYNLDGGGSSTMYFNGNVVNRPTTNGNSIKERSVSDIVYIGK